MPSRRTLAANLALVCLSSFAWGQLQIPATGHLHVDFTGYTGGGFQPIPTAGQLSSNDWAATGMSDGILDFGGVQTSGDFARGISTGGVIVTGFYSFDLGGNILFGIQPGSPDWNPGTLTLRLQNDTGVDLTKLNMEYTIYARNDQSRSSSMNSFYSVDGSEYVALSALDFSSPELPDGLGFVSAVRSTSISTLSVPAGGFVYIRWTSQDVSGTGSRDELGLDDIKVSAGDEPLPVELLSITASISGSSVELRWTTLSETNNYGYEVQKTDTTQVDYQTIAKSFVPGHGTTNQSQHYSYVDPTVASGDWYYRLKQIDVDGTIHYSEGVRVSLLTSVKEKEIPSAFSISQNYPNPFNPSTTIRYGLPRRTNVSLSVFNTLGQQVAILVQGEREAGYHEVKFDGSGSPSGIYVYRLSAGSFVEAKKLLLLR